MEKTNNKPEIYNNPLVKDFEKRHNATLLGCLESDDTLVFKDNETNELMEIDISNIGINGEEYYTYELDVSYKDGK